ncbi:MAG: calcium/sodium antiporter [Deltaproteobacteria bacterium]|nr:calcium/sodium antiporter [Deltaproteobacteria bacterium]
MDLLLLVLGLVLLLGGGEALVRGASGLALLGRLSPAVVGLTVVAAGTSMPELVVSVQAALAGQVGIAAGNVVGSNIFNIGMILGLTALIRPLRIQGQTVRLEWPVMMLASLQLYLLSRDGLVDRVEGGFLLVALAAFVAYLVWIGRRTALTGELADEETLATASYGQEGARAWGLNLAATALGIAVLAGGASLTVRGATGIAAALGVSDTIIGLTVVAAGTSAPELVTSLVAAWRGRDDLAVANIVGSNIFNLLGILGTTALVRALPVPPEILQRDLWWMLGASLLLLPLMWTGRLLDRREGALLLAGMIAYLALLVVAATSGA